MDDANKAVKLWVKKSNKKKARLLSYESGSYKIVYFDKNKVRIGAVHDGMRCRYGVSCYGAMSSNNITSLWQVAPGACSEEDIKIMKSYFLGKTSLPEFDFSTIKNLIW